MYCIKPSILQTPVSNEGILLLEPERGFYFELNETSVFIFNALKDGLSVIDIIDKMIEIYEVDVQTAQKDVNFFIRQLLEHNIIELHKKTS